jgi:hypothetical protein
VVGHEEDALPRFAQAGQVAARGCAAWRPFAYGNRFYCNGIRTKIQSNKTNNPIKLLKVVKYDFIDFQARVVWRPYR